MRKLKRRHFLQGSASLAVSPFLGCQTTQVKPKKIRFKHYPFQLGIASGEPLPDGFVIWTRLAPEPLLGGGMPPHHVEVAWEVSQTPNMKQIVRKGIAIAGPEMGHSVHVELEGLEPGRWYWYRFIAGGEKSLVGRTRTAPPVDAAVNRFRFTVASCQHYEHGYFTAYQHMADEDIDLIVHLGDYIYEGGACVTPTCVRPHVGPEIEELDDYRNRHAQYKMDKHLQRAHAIAPWLQVFDDHEVDNNYANAISENTDVSAQEFLVRRAIAYKAFYEHTPIRPSMQPIGPHLPLYRAAGFGDLIRFRMLDTRQYRTDQPCGDRKKPLCKEVFDPDATLLGKEQKDWLFSDLKQSRTQWNVLAQQVMMARVDRQAGPAAVYSMDQWSGYDSERKELLTFLSDKAVSNPIVLTGDIHANWVNDLKVDFDKPETPTVATEFVSTSISSEGDGIEIHPAADSILSENPFVKFVNAERGYLYCDVTPEQWRSEFRVVPYVSRPGAPLIKRATYIVKNDQAGAHRI